MYGYCLAYVDVISGDKASTTLTLQYTGGDSLVIRTCGERWTKTELYDRYVIQ
jgi:hypothetical protein